MKRFLPALAFLILIPRLWAIYGQENPRLEKLFGTFMSPCCWQQNLTVHDSPIANELRSQIRQAVLDGRTDEEIKASLVKQYSKRILALPEGAGRVWLFWTPWVAIAAGLLGLALAIRHFRSTRAEQAFTGVAPVEIDEELFSD